MQVVTQVVNKIKYETDLPKNIKHRNIKQYVPTKARGEVRLNNSLKQNSLQWKTKA